jgi:hypothetical protein
VGEPRKKQFVGRPDVLIALQPLAIVIPRPRQDLRIQVLPNAATAVAAAPFREEEHRAGGVPKLLKSSDRNENPSVRHDWVRLKVAG